MKSCCIGNNFQPPGTVMGKNVEKNVCVYIYIYVCMCN